MRERQAAEFRYEQIKQELPSRKVTPAASAVQTFKKRARVRKRENIGRTTTTNPLRTTIFEKYHDRSSFSSRSHPTRRVPNEKKMNGQETHPRVLPPHLPPDVLRPSLELPGLGRQVVRLVHQQLDALSTGKDLEETYRQDRALFEGGRRTKRTASMLLT